MNKFVLLSLCLAFGARHTSARILVVTGGRSPDKTLEVAVSSPTAPAGLCEDFPEQYHYSLVLRQVGTGKVLFENLDRWQTSFFSVGSRPSPTRAFWSADSHFVALSFDGANHTKALRLFSVHGRTAEEVFLPDYVRAVFASLGVEDVKSLEAEPVRWRKHTLKVSLHGNTSEPRSETGGYDFDFSASLKVQFRDHTTKADLSSLQDNPSTPKASPIAAANG